MTPITVRPSLPPYPPHGCAHLAHPCAICAIHLKTSIRRNLAHLAHLKPVGGSGAKSGGNDDMTTINCPRG